MSVLTSSLVFERIASIAAVRAADVAVVAGTERLSYGRLMSLATQRAKDMAAGERVALSSYSAVDVVIGVLAAWRAGAVPAVLHRHDAAAHTVVLDRAGSVTDRTEGLVLTTSGTSGRSKLVSLPHRSQAITAATVAADVGFTPDDRLMLATPASHATGLLGVCLAGLWAGSQIDMPEAAAPIPVLLARIRARAVTGLQGPPALFRFFDRYWGGEPLPRVRSVVVGGEPVSPRFLERLGGMFPTAAVTVLYGVTECGPRVCHVRLPDTRAASGYVGVPFPHFDYRVDEAGVAGDDIGQLLLGGPAVMLGYLDGDGRHVGIDDHGRFPTRDLVRVDPDGGLWLHGRMDACFKVGGRLVDPVAIEREIHDSGMVAAVRCLADPHELLGAVAAAEVVPSDPVRFQVTGLHAYLRRRLPAHERPRRIEIVDRIATTASGKVIRCPSLAV